MYEGRGQEVAAREKQYDVIDKLRGGEEKQLICKQQMKNVANFVLREIPVD